ncbi:MAG: endonuclease III, partial [Elusimicrobiota bacterium]
MTVSVDQKKLYAVAVLDILDKTYPDATVALVYGSPWELLVSTILSAQCTDTRVNIVTKTLFKKYKDMRSYADAVLPEFEQEIRSTGFYHNKAKNIVNSARMILTKFGGEVPQTMEELLELPGVARKTANIVLTGAYNVVSGIAVDTHVKRLAGRLGLTKNTDPCKIEEDLMGLIPKNRWGKVNYILVTH